MSELLARFKCPLRATFVAFKVKIRTDLSSLYLSPMFQRMSIVHPCRRHGVVSIERDQFLCGGGDNRGGERR